MVSNLMKQIHLQQCKQEEKRLACTEKIVKALPQLEEILVVMTHCLPINKKKRREDEFKAGTKKEEVSVYDIVLSHLIDEGYADTVESAEGIMVNMSEEWRDSIVEENHAASLYVKG